MDIARTARPAGLFPKLISQVGATPWIVTVFFSAALIFLIQPMYAKMATPLLGGSPSVWNVSLVCFQGALLAGYAYAHGLARLVPLRMQVAIHGALLVLAALALPLSISGIFGDPNPEQPVLWLAGTFMVSIAPPFAMLSATAPLIQHWYARTGRDDAADPYHLYSASNAGSLVGLIAYPILMEPLAPLGTQSLLWSASYGIVATLLIACGLILLMQHRLQENAAIPVLTSDKKTGWREKSYWLLLSAIPSGLLLGTTSHISTDIASAPFLWAPPLMAYISTFIIVFAKKPLIRQETASKYMIYVVVLALLTLGLPTYTTLNVVLSLVLHTGALFMASLCLHGALVARRPDASGLTEFYLLMSLGGVLGSSFVALLAPVIFNGITEYPLLLIAALLLNPRILTLRALPALRTRRTMILASALALSIAALAYVSLGHSGYTITTRRGFFGVVKVFSAPDANITFMKHGNTLHGAQLMHEEGRPTPLTYYNSATPIGQAFQLLADKADTIGVVGLGAGSVACHARPGQSFTYYEIDPIVAETATNPDHFTFLSDCTPGARIELGDARITLGYAPEKAYDLLLLDAFSSDAIPVHLLTREAMALYLSRLSDDGVLVFHITNRHVDLLPVLARVAEAEGAVAMYQFFQPEDDIREAFHVQRTKVMVFAKSDAALAHFKADSRWQMVTADDRRAWTDDYSNLLGAIIESHVGH